MKANYKNKEWLIEQYVQLKKSTCQISKEIGINKTTILKWLKRHGIERRHRKAPIVPCAYCGRLIKMKPYRVKDKNYCSISHQLKYAYEHGLRMPEKITENAHIKTKQIFQAGLHPFQKPSIRNKLREIMQTPEYRLKCSQAKLGPKNGMYGKNGQLHPNWRRVECKCAYCGKIFYQKRSHVEIGEGKYCSNACRLASLPVKSIKYCLYCGKQFAVVNGRKETAFYCSVDCYHKGICGENSILWKGGKSFEPYTSEFNGQLKKQIRKRDDYRCQLCGIHQAGLKDVHKNAHKLHVHHVDYNKLNNFSENLISLCNRCHQKTGNNRPDWQSYFSNLINQRPNIGAEVEY